MSHRAPSEMKGRLRTADSQSPHNPPSTSWVFRVRGRRPAASGLLAACALTSLLACGEGAPPDPQTPEEFAAATTIHRDEWGVPHISGPTDASVVFGWMFAQAEDNFWQIEDSLIQALGRAAEIRGAEALPGDLLNRALEIPRLSQEEWQALQQSDPKVASLLEAAADGLDYYIATHPQAEVRLLRDVEPWHLLAMSRFAVYQLFMMGRSGIRAEEMASLAEPVVVAEAAEVRQLDPSADSPDLKRLFEQAFDAAPGPAQAAQQVAGSNMWAVRGERTQGGAPLLFINPHQPYFGPGQWIEGHLRSEEGLHFSGAGFPGTFLPTIGHNETVGWSHTVNTPDILDVYEITFGDEDPLSYRYGDENRPVTTWTDRVAVLGEDGSLNDTEYRFRKTHHGPIVGTRDGKGLALRMAMFEEGGQSQMRYRMAKAKDVFELKDAMASLATPMFNTVAADQSGNIWYVYYGAVPRRDEQFDWSRPVDGSDPRTEWQGYHPIDELPQILNPASGYVQNCNATPFLASGEGDNPDPESFPAYMAPEDDNARSRISRRILENDGPFDLDSWARLAFDTRVIEAEVWIPRLAEAIAAAPRADARKLAEPLALLEGWDGVSTVDSTAMTLFFAWREAMLVGRMEDLVESFGFAVDSLQGVWGSWEVPWGEINRLQRIHTSGAPQTADGGFSDERPSVAVPGGPGPLGIVFNFYTRPAEGQKRRYGVAGHSFVSVVEFGEAVEARSALVFGQSADPASPHHFDQAELFAEGRFKPAWFTADDVGANAVRSYRLDEAGSN